MRPGAADPPSVLVETASAEATRALGRALGRAVRPLPAGGLVLVLGGELGAGKTELARGLARGLGVPEDVPVASPTFVVARSYAAGDLVLWHVDAYRLAGAEEAEAAGLEEMWGDARVACVEWGARIAEALPADRLEVEIEMVPDPGRPGPSTRRRVRLTPRGPGSSALLARARGAVLAAGTP